MKDPFEQDVNHEFEKYFLSGSATNPTVSANLTFEDLETAMRLIEKPVMWYADTPWIERGRAYKVSADKDGWYPEYHVFNVTDFFEMQPEMAKAYTLRHVREYVPQLRLNLQMEMSNG